MKCTLQEVTRAYHEPAKPEVLSSLSHKWASHFHLSTCLRIFALSPYYFFAKTVSLLYTHALDSHHYALFVYSYHTRSASSSRLSARDRGFLDIQAFESPRLGSSRT